jgi:hypothetical protein
MDIRFSMFNFIYNYTLLDYYYFSSEFFKNYYIYSYFFYFSESGSYFNYFDLSSNYFTYIKYDYNVFWTFGYNYDFIQPISYSTYLLNTFGERWFSNCDVDSYKLSEYLFFNRKFNYWLIYSNFFFEQYPLINFKGNSLSHGSFISRDLINNYYSREFLKRYFTDLSKNLFFNSSTGILPENAVLNSFFSSFVNFLDNLKLVVYYKQLPSNFGLGYFAKNDYILNQISRDDLGLKFLILNSFFFDNHPAFHKQDTNFYYNLASLTDFLKLFSFYKNFKEMQLLSDGELYLDKLYNSILFNKSIVQNFFCVDFHPFFYYNFYDSFLPMQTRSIFFFSDTLNYNLVYDKVIFNINQGYLNSGNIYECKKIFI